MFNQMKKFHLDSCAMHNLQHVGDKQGGVYLPGTLL